MNIKFTPVFTGKDIEKDIQRNLKILHEEVVSRIQRVGLQFVIDARKKVSSTEYREALASMAHAKGTPRAELGPESPGFNDITGNLRSSIGFLIMYDGEVVDENFEQSDKGTDKTTGLGLGRAYAEKVGKDHPKGYALITVAGMEYAAAVEALGYDVISGSTLGAAGKMGDVWKKVAEAMK